MRTTTEERICDCCGRASTQCFDGWLHVESELGGFYKYLRAKSPWDFCSAECCVNFLQPMTLARGGK